jgi:hypothetical protein
MKLRIEGRCVQDADWMGSGRRHVRRAPDRKCITTNARKNSCVRFAAITLSTLPRCTGTGCPHKRSGLTNSQCCCRGDTFSLLLSTSVVFTTPFGEKTLFLIFPTYSSCIANMGFSATQEHMKYPTSKSTVLYYTCGRIRRRRKVTALARLVFSTKMAWRTI